MAETKRLHWTQTPEGRAKLAKAMKKGWKTRRKSEAMRKAKTTRVTRKKRGKNVIKIEEEIPTEETRKTQTQEEKESIATAIGLAHCDAWLSIFADTWGLSRSALARRVGEALCRQAGR